MSEEILTLVKAIESLQTKSDIFKDYAFPLLMAFFSTLLGAFVAFFTIRHQDKIGSVKDNISSMNECTLALENAMASLVAVKSNYANELDSHPVQRTLKIKSIVDDLPRIDFKLSSLSYIVPRKDDISSQNEKWRNLPEVRSLIGNYNSLVDIWGKRRELERPIKKKLVKAYGSNAYATISIAEIYSCVDSSEFAILVDLTERAVKYTDDLLIAIDDFLENFPKIGEELISRRHRKLYGPLITFSSNENQRLLAMLTRTKEVDYDYLGSLFGLCAEEARKQYETGYE